MEWWNGDYLLLVFTEKRTRINVLALQKTIMGKFLIGY